MLDDLPFEVREESESYLAQAAVSDDPYRSQAEARGCLLDVLADSLLACELDGLWWAFDEMCDVWPDQRTEAHEMVRQAATEWLALRDDEEIDSYLDLWDLRIHKALLVWGPSPIAPNHAIPPDRFNPPTPRVTK